MKRIPFLLLCLLLFNACDDRLERLFHLPKKEPAEFPGGKQALNQYLSRNLRYPPEAIEQEIEGKVFVSFTVNKNGKVSDVRVVKHVHPVLDNEARRVVASMPLWRPGSVNGKPEKSYFNLPITFRLQ